MSHNCRWLESPPGCVCWPIIIHSTKDLFFFFLVLGLLSPCSFFTLRESGDERGQIMTHCYYGDQKQLSSCVGWFSPFLTSCYSTRVKDFYQVEIWAFEIFSFSSSLWERVTPQNTFHYFEMKCQENVGFGVVKFPVIMVFGFWTCSYFVLSFWLAYYSHEWEDMECF